MKKKFQKIKKPSWDNLFYRHGDDEVMGGMVNLSQQMKNYQN